MKKFIIKSEKNVKRSYVVNFNVDLLLQIILKF
jgi:hypothetical protein